MNQLAKLILMEVDYNERPTFEVSRHQFFALRSEQECRLFNETICINCGEIYNEKEVYEDYGCGFEPMKCQCDRTQLICSRCVQV